MVLCKLMRGLFDVHIGGFGFLCVDDANAVHALYLTLAALYLIRVKNQNHFAFFIALKVAEYIDKLLSRPVKAQLSEVLPRENNVVAVHKQVLRSVVIRKLFGFLA